MKAQKRSRSIPLLFLYPRRVMGWVVNAPHRPLSGPVPIAQEAGWATGPIWTGPEYVAPTGLDPRTVQTIASGYTEYAIPTS